MYFKNAAFRLVVKHIKVPSIANDGNFTADLIEFSDFFGKVCSFSLRNLFLVTYPELINTNWCVLKKNWSFGPEDCILEWSEVSQSF